MMAKGRKKIPDALKVIKGTFQPCRAANTDAVQSDDELEYIDFKSENPRDYFEAIKAELAEIGLNSRSYSMLVSSTAQRCADLAIARNARDAVGLVLETTTQNGDTMLRRHPADTAVGEAFKDIRSALTEFRLTPSKIGTALKKEPEKNVGFGGL
jgi:hypothetical protein